MNIKTEFSLGDLVYLKTDTDQKQRMVTKISITPAGIYYDINCGVEDSSHYSLEMTTEKDWTKT